jgi:hypothetical protein
MDEINKEYINFINFSLKKMDDGYYEESLINLKKIISANHFKNLKTNDQLFIRKRISWVQLSLGFYEEGWNNFVYNWLKNSHKFEKINTQNKSIKYLINFNQIKANDKLLVWNDGGFGDFIYQLRFLEFLKDKINFKIYDSKMSHLLRDKSLIASDSKNFNWHLAINELPRIFRYSPLKYSNFNYNYLIHPSKQFKEYKNFVALCYKTNTSKSKSINYELLEKLFVKKNNLEFIIISNYFENNELLFLSSFKNVHVIKDMDKSNLFVDTFNIINSVKFVISIDTAITHISGYLAKKTYLLLNNPGSFYWGINKEKISDYPNHKIVRQKTNGDWTSVIEDIIKLI